MQAEGQPVLPSGLRKGQELVYLSADSEEELSTLSENEVYIIGGLVDRNRYKVSCLDDLADGPRCFVKIKPRDWEYVLLDFQSAPTLTICPPGKS
jgi:hypothetical protein